MTAIILGLVSFLLFGFYDVNQVKWNNKWLGWLFFLGVLGLLGSTLWLLLDGKVFSEGNIGQIIFLSISGGFFLLLFYTLFLALPFTGTYIEGQGKNGKKVCSIGMYGICRHPGFIWFTAAYILLALAIQNRTATTMVAVFIVCNFLYVLLQDRWTFPHLFEDYENYKNKVPFLVPTVASVKASFPITRKED